MDKDEHIILVMQNQIKNLKEKLELERSEHRSIYSKLKNENEILTNELYKHKLKYNDIYD